MDVSRIENRFVRENHLVGLGFPTQGYVFMRVNGVESIYYEYDEFGTIAADTQADAARLGRAADKIDNILRITDCNHMYQLFMGWQPGCVRQYLYFPYETGRRNLDERRILSKGDFGFISGFDSPWDCPSPDTELFIPKDVDVGFAWYNESEETVALRIFMVIRRLGIDILRDADLIEKILAGKQPCRLVTLGGVEASLGYRATSSLDVDFIKLGAARTEIEKALA
jgi:hypothetical protein